MAKNYFSDARINRFASTFIWDYFSKCVIKSISEDKNELELVKDGLKSNFSADEVQGILDVIDTRNTVGTPIEDVISKDLELKVIAFAIWSRAKNLSDVQVRNVLDEYGIEVVMNDAVDTIVAKYHEFK